MSHKYSLQPSGCREKQVVGEIKKKLLDYEEINKWIWLKIYEILLFQKLDISQYFGSYEQKIFNHI